MNRTEAFAGGGPRRSIAEQRPAHGFVLRGVGTPIRTVGLRAKLPAGSAGTLDDRVRAFFAAAEGPAVVVGALPFDPRRDVLCFQPEWFDRSSAGEGRDLPSGVLLTSSPLRVSPSNDALTASYALAVERALGRIASGRLRKVVLARRLQIESPGPIDHESLLERLARDASVTTFLVDLSAASGIDGHKLVGATPELLVSRSNRRIASNPLAGSAPRSADAARDRAIAEGLLRSDKDQREHAVVVEAILDTLAPLCSELATPDGLTLRSTATMWHLMTRIEGVLKSDEGPTAAGLAALLHPTPAVGGDPRDAALEAIRELEAHDRGFYAGAVGWTDARGDGEWYVALRCAEIRGTRLTLHAGAGVVLGSDPAREVAETSAKFRTMLHALGLDEAETEKAAS